MEIHFFSNDIYMNLSVIVSFVLFSFLSFLFITYILSLLKKKELRRYAGKFPNLSIIIPAYNEEQNIENCLKSVLHSDYPSEDMEIIVVDDKSTDKTAKIVEDIISETTSHKIKLIRGSHKGKPESLNLGLVHAKYEHIMTIDADVILEKNTIKKLVSPMKNEKVAATNSVAAIRNPKSMIEYFQMIEFSLNNLIRTSFSKVYKNSIWFFGAVAVYKKSVLEEIGKFKNDTLTEDMDICLEMYEKNYQIVTVEDAIISTEPCHSIRELFNQRMRWYFGALQSLFKNKLLLKHRNSPSITFLFFNQIWWTIFSFLFFPMTAYQVYYWFPEQTLEAVFYIMRWFSLAGPVYVLYKIPDWGLNILNIFGVLSGIITLIMSFYAIKKFKSWVNIKTLIALFFYFPYTILINLILISGIVKYTFSKKRYFIN